MITNQANMLLGAQYREPESIGTRIAKGVLGANIGAAAGGALSGAVSGMYRKAPYGWPVTGSLAALGALLGGLKGAGISIKAVPTQQDLT